jgi:dGTPase
VQDLALWSHPGAEAQVAAIADDIAYDAHDIDDGLRAGLFTLDDIAAVPLVHDILSEIRAQHGPLDEARLIHEIIRRLITRLIEDVIAETGRRLTAMDVRSAEEVRAADTSVAAFSAAMAEADRAIKSFLHPRMYRHDRVMGIMRQAEDVVCDLFARYTAHPHDLPLEWADRTEAADRAQRPRAIADFIAGMTDRYALMEHARLFDSTPELR